MGLRKLLGLAGSLALVLGVFAPLISVPVVGATTYYQNGNTEGIILLAIAGAALLCTFVRLYALLPLLGFAALGVTAYSFIAVQRKFSNARGRVAEELGPGALRDIADRAIDTVQMQWGWAMLAIGAVLLMAVALLSKRA